MGAVLSRGRDCAWSFVAGAAGVGTMVGMTISSSARAADGSRLRLLHVHAHPDDESSKGAATTARYVSEGIEVMVATCTGGERGSVLNPKMDRPDVWENITSIREQEMHLAREILGVRHVALGFEDSGLPEGDPLPPLPAGCFATLDPQEAARPLVEVIRRFRPHVITTYDESGGYPHPDHVQCNRVTIAALGQAAAPGHAQELGDAWRVPKMYYQFGFHRRRFAALDAGMRANDLESPYGERLQMWQDRNYEHRITTRVECGEFFEVRDDALRAHASQVDPDGMWFAVPLEIQRAVWPTEDWQLVYSAVPTVIPEDDLFAGLRPDPPQAPDPARLWEP